MSESDLSILLDSSRLRKNTIFNFTSQSVPLLAGIIAIPLLISIIGVERFGFLTIAWVLVGYMSLFDLGIGRALTHEAAILAGQKKINELCTFVWTAMFAFIFLGIIAGAFILALSNKIVLSYLNLPDFMLAESKVAIQFLSFAIPATILSTGLRGLLEALQRFDKVLIIRIPIGVWTFLGPLAGAYYRDNLVFVIGALVIGRWIGTFFYMLNCIFELPQLKQNIRFSTDALKKLLKFGGWMTVSNIIGPILFYLDRFFLAGIFSVSEIAYYTTPHEITTKLLIIPGAIAGVMFPAISASLSGSQHISSQIYRRSLGFVFFVMLAVCLLLFLSIDPILTLWLNADFSMYSGPIARVLIFAVFINALGIICQSVVQASGRPDLSAKLHLIELALFIPYLWILISIYGIIGAAYAWLIRVSISTIVLFYFSEKLMKGLKTHASRRIH